MRHAFRRPTAPLPSLLLIALAACGSSDGGSGGGAPDTEDPTVTITAPEPGATVSGDVTLTATASDNESVAGVQFEVDGAALGAEATDPPYQAIWHAAGAGAGTHTLRATARDPSGNLGDAEPVEVTVAEAATGAIQVSVATTGDGTDADGYTVAVDASGRGTVDANGTLTVEGLTLGAHTVTLAGISPFCRSVDDPVRQVTVGLEPTSASFELTCDAVPAGRIAFTAVAGVGDPLEIHTIRADGTGETTVATDGDFAAWSPDGTQIAFLRRGVNITTLYRVNADGTGLTQLATLPSFAEELDWGSGGTLAFSAVRSAVGGTHVPDLYFIEADGSNLRPVFPAAASRLSPAWSPDGTRLAFSAVQPDGDHADLTLANPDGSSSEPITSGFWDLSASWSPDGHMLAFRRDDFTAGITEVWTIGADGSGLRKLGSSGGPQFSPSWSPDGPWVAFTSENVSGQPLLFARTDGSGLMQVHSAFPFTGQPDWGPPGE